MLKTTLHILAILSKNALFRKFFFIHYHRDGAKSERFARKIGVLKTTIYLRKPALFVNFA
jgi:hypothetical protein